MKYVFPATIYTAHAVIHDYIPANKRLTIYTKSVTISVDDKSTDLFTSIIFDQR